MLDVVNSGLMDDSLLDSGLENADDFLSGDGQNVGNLGKEFPEKIVHNCDFFLCLLFPRRGWLVGRVVRSRGAEILRLQPGFLRRHGRLR